MALLQQVAMVVLVVDDVDVEVEVDVSDVAVELEVLVLDVEVEVDVVAKVDEVELVDVLPPDGEPQAFGAGESLRLRTPSTFLTFRPPNSAQ
jgi:hypothetical protein